MHFATCCAALQIVRDGTLFFLKIKKRYICTYLTSYFLFLTTMSNLLALIVQTKRLQYLNFGNNKKK